MSHNYVQILTALEAAGLTHDLTPLDKHSIQKMKEENPGIPGDYLEYLQNVGWGNIGESYMVYSGPIDPEDIFGVREDANLEHIALFGDGFSGDCDGFSIEKNWELVYIDHVSLKVYTWDLTFEAFIKKKINRILRNTKKTKDLSR